MPEHRGDIGVQLLEGHFTRFNGNYSAISVDEVDRRKRGDSVVVCDREQSVTANAVEGLKAVREEIEIGRLKHAGFIEAERTSRDGDDVDAIPIDLLQLIERRYLMLTMGTPNREQFENVRPLRLRAIVGAARGWFADCRCCRTDDERRVVRCANGRDTKETEQGCDGDEISQNAILVAVGLFGDLTHFYITSMLNAVVTDPLIETATRYAPARMKTLFP